MRGEVSTFWPECLSLRPMRILAICVLAAVGCSSKKADPPQPTAAEAAAQKASPGDTLIGVWKVDLVALQDSAELKAMDEAGREKALELARQHLAGLRFDFAKDGKFAVTFAKATQRGTWTVKQTDGDTLTIETTQSKGGEPKADQVQVRFTGDRAVLTGPDGKPVTFQRAK